ncbi:MAG: 2-C-methyl-D-erythritol 2,4-cyclodiphosphate synthase [Candidatus Paceibacteria bacterium]|jgi:2-C-methyl-D-erythritol 2,4-cyclodiphosphate synthase
MSQNKIPYRVGLGFDLHRLVAGRPCMLGGVQLPHDTGPSGHSDGDAVLHAITDAILGAAGLDDIGTLFPDTDPKWQGANSAQFLEAALLAAREKGWRVGNIDIVIATEGPRIAPHRERMRARIAELTAVTPDEINVKGKTLEGMGALAAGAGVGVQAVCLLWDAGGA